MLLCDKERACGCVTRVFRFSKLKSICSDAFTSNLAPDSDLWSPSRRRLARQSQQCRQPQRGHHIKDILQDAKTSLSHRTILRGAIELVGRMAASVFMHSTNLAQLLIIYILDILACCRVCCYETTCLNKAAIGSFDIMEYPQDERIASQRCLRATWK